MKKICNPLDDAWFVDSNKVRQTTKVENVEMKNPKQKVYKCLNCGQYTHRTSWSSPVNYCTRCGLRLEWE